MRRGYTTYIIAYIYIRIYKEVCLIPKYSSSAIYEYKLMICLVKSLIKQMNVKFKCSQNVLLNQSVDSSSASVKALSDHRERGSHAI